EDPVGDEAEGEDLLADRHVEHQGARVWRLLGPRHAETKTQVDDRHTLASHVPETEQVFRPVRDLEGILVVEDLPDDRDRHREDLVVETEGDELRFGGCAGHDQALSLKSASSASGPPIDMSRAKPRAR